MANKKSFVFNSTNDSQPLVTPPAGQYHLYVNSAGQMQVINHLGEVVPQITSISSVDFNSIQMIPQTVLPDPQPGLIFFSAGTGLMICQGTGSTNWVDFYTQHGTSPYPG